MTIKRGTGRNKKQGLWRRAVMMLCAVTMLLGSAKLPAEAKDSGSAIGVGIDVSKYQGMINWASVKASGVTFAFVRMGNTEKGIDPYFDINMRGAAAAGIRTGVYIYSYATTLEEATAEAYWVLNSISPYTVSMPVVFDLEDKSQERLSPEALAAIATQFCSIIEAAGYYPMVYSSKYWFTNRIGAIGYDKWVAQYNTYCAIEDAAFWQASCTTKLPGIQGNVDLNYQYKDLSTQIIPYGFVARKGYAYFYENYRMKTNSWVDYAGYRYYVDNMGRRLSGTFASLGGGIYCFDADGRMLTGWRDLAEYRYYFGEDGNMRIGLQQIGDLVYLFDATGRMYTGWYQAEGLTAFYYPDGHMAFGLSQIGDANYYFNESGCLMTGWVIADGKQMYFDPATGQEVFGWLSDGTGLFYTDAAGNALKGFQGIDGTTYYFGEEGRMRLGWQVIDGARYYFDPLQNGKMLTGMQAVGNEVFYFAENGRLATGLITAGDATYYFDPTTGAQKTGFLPIGTNVYYFNPATGAQAMGLIRVGDSYHYFDPAQNGAMLVNTMAVLSGAYYVFDANGVMTPTGVPAPAGTPDGVVAVPLQ